VKVNANANALVISHCRRLAPDALFNDIDVIKAVFILVIVCSRQLKEERCA
jgi:hypothetical protein